MGWRSASFRTMKYRPSYFCVGSDSFLEVVAAAGRLFGEVDHSDPVGPANLEFAEFYLPAE